jgi:hypothetical protein
MVQSGPFRPKKRQEKERQAMRILASIALALASLIAAAQEADTPGRVGRIAFIEGAAAIYQDPDQGWDKAYVNSPFTSENSVWTDPASRVELRVGSTAVRLDETTQIDISRLDDEALEAFIPRGTVAVRVRHYDQAFNLRFDTPYARFTLRGDGRYRIDVDPDRSESRITVLTGDARIGSDSGNLRAGPGQTVRVFGGDSPSYVVEAAMRDPFDQWSAGRDARWVESTAPRYVSTDMTGYEELDNNGQWANEPEYGALWYPTQVAAGWAPYRHGHWGYVRPWGWTWIDDASWGYAPFHYGRWVYIRDRWAWHPGVREAHPVWAPALVAWVGGAGLTVGVSSPSVGWYPLSPWDRYQPWYRASPAYVTRVNVVVINTPPRAEAVQWRNFTRDQGVTVVNRQVVVDRRPVQAALIQNQAAVVRNAQVSTPAALLPARAEVIQRHAVLRNEAVARGQSLPGQTVVPSSGVRIAPAARPEFGRALPAAAAVTPQRATAPAPAAQRVTPGPVVQRPGPQPTAQELQEQQQARQRSEEQRAARAAQQRPQQPQQPQAQQQQQQEQARQRAEEQRAARDAQQRQQTPQQREELKQQQQQEQQQARQRTEEQRAAREAQQRQQQQQQQRAQPQAQPKPEPTRQEQLQQRQQEQQHAQPLPQAKPKAEPQPPARTKAEPAPQRPEKSKEEEEKEKKKKEDEKKQGR